MQEIKTYVLMGRPGSGKGTQSKLLAEKLGGVVYSSGNRLREMIASGSYFGQRAKDIMDHGHLMPIWVSQYLFEEELIKIEPTDIVIFEGACRIEEEAHRFHEAALWLERPYTVVFLDSHEDGLRERLIKRAGLESRADDHVSVLQERFDNFNALTQKSIEYFRSQGTLVTVDGNQSIEAVHADILKALNLS